MHNISMLKVKSSKFVLLTSALLFSGLTACALSAQSTSVHTGAQISISGNGEISGEADQARINLNVRSQAKNSADAKNEVDHRIDAFFDKLEALGLSDEAITAGAMNIAPQYDYQNRQSRFIGFQASRSIGVDLSDLELLHPILDAAVSMQIDEIQGINYSSSKEDDMRQQARLAAIEDSKTKAKQLANAYDAKLGSVYSINYHSGSIQQNYQPQANVRMASLEADSSGGGRFIPGKVTVRDNISVVFDLITD